MKAVLIAAALATVVVGPAAAKSKHRAGASAPAAAQQAFGAVTPFGTPDQVRMSPARETALRECSDLAKRYADKDSVMPTQQFRACMAWHGQPE